MKTDKKLPFDPALLFITLADGKPVTMLRAAALPEAFEYLKQLEKRRLVTMLPLDEARFNVALTERGLALFLRSAKKLRVTVEKVRDVPKKPTRRPSA